nr:putative ribonuclease H-like domain-containing protein [Tanacetum cinerariifolium]
MNTDHNLWKIIQNGNSKKSLGRDSKGGIIILHPVSFKEHVVVQRDTKARTLLLQSLPEDHMADFHHLDNAREIWLAVKARFSGNEESKKMRKPMLKQAFSEFSAKPDNDDVNFKFLKALPPSWSQVALTLKTRGGLEYLSFDNLYNKLRSLEIDVKGGSSYGSRSTTVAPTHSAFIGAASTNTQMVYSDQPSYSSLFSYTPAPFGSIMEDVLHSFVAENEPTQQLAYKDFEQLEHFARECNVKKVDEKARYSAFKISETEEAEQVYSLMAGFESDFAVHAGNAAGGVNHAAAEFAMMGISPKEWEIKFVKSLARFDKWEKSSKNLAKLLYSSMSTRTKLGLGFKEYIRSEEVCDLSTPSVFDPKPENREGKSLYERFVKAETQATFGLKSNTSSITTSESNNFVSYDNSDKSSTSETYDFAFCVSSPKSNDSFSTVDVNLLPKSDVKDPSLTNGLPSCSFKENVKPPRNLYNKSGTADRIPCKNNFARTKKCFVCDSKSHLIKDCHVYDTVDNFPSVVLKAASVPAGSRNSSASTSAGRSIPAASRNRSASIHAGRSIHAASRNRSAYIHADRSILAASRNRPTSIHADLICNGVPRTMVDLINLHGFALNDPQGRLKLKEVQLHLEVEMNFNLFSVSQICDKKNKVRFTDDECLVLTKEFQLPDENQVVLRIPIRHDLYTFNLSDIQPEQHINCLLAKASLEESTKWHRRMSHVNFKTINKLAKHGLVDGLPLKLFTNEHNCVACNKGKQHKASYKAISTVRIIFKPLQLLHMDLFGPTSIKSIDHKYYSLVVTDDFSRFCWAFFLGTKDETFYILKDFIALIENQLNKKFKAIRCDNGTEFQNAKLIALCEEKGIKRDYSNARTPQQNGVAERKNRTLIEAARSMES